MEELDSLLNKFEFVLKQKDAASKNGKSLQDMYVYKIRDYFLKYIENIIIDLSHQDKINIFFESVLNRQYIIDAAVDYVERNKPKPKDATLNSCEKSASSVKDILTAINEFYKIALMDKYHNQTLNNLEPFTKSLKQSVIDKVIKDDFILVDKVSYPAIEKPQYEYIINYIKQVMNLSFMDRQISIIFQLFLLFGFTLDKIAGLKKGCFSDEKRTLTIPCNNSDQSGVFYIELELPYLLFKEISIHLKSLEPYENDSLLFTTERNNPVTSSSFNYFIKNIRKAYAKVDNNKQIQKRFTTYGMAKYAISEMLNISITEPSIVALTGRSIEFIESCIPETNKNSIKKKHYINYKLRSIKTFCDMQ